MPRYRLTLEYDGTAFHGYQAQGPGLPSVQEAVETAIFAFSGERIRLQAAGRTDTGVHATGQVVHADLEKDWPARTVLNALNAHLIEQAVSVLDAGIADGDWHDRARLIVDAMGSVPPGVAHRRATAVRARKKARRTPVSDRGPQGGFPPGDDVRVGARDIVRRTIDQAVATIQQVTATIDET